MIKTVIFAVEYSQFAELFPPVVLTHHDVFQSRPSEHKQTITTWTK